jgi:hypothetical protein
MTTLQFRYSDIYDQTLDRIAGKTEGNATLFSDGNAFAQKYSEYWQQYNEPIFLYYQQFSLIVSEFLTTYFVYPKPGLTAFSDPLTLTIKSDLEEITASLVHELCHNFLIYSYYHRTGVNAKLYSHVHQVFEKEPRGAQIHIIVNILTRYGLLQIYGPIKTQALLNKEKNYPGLERAWEIIDAHPAVFKQPDPIAAIMSLNNA